MAAGRLCLLLLLVALAAARAAAEPMGVGVRVSPPRPRERDLVIEEGSGDGDEVEEDGEADVTVLKPATKKQTKQSLTGSKILDGVVPSTAQSFFNYGMGFALLTYITMGISYFYGPYSASAFLANKRANQRMKYLEHQMKDEEEESEYDYGNYAQEEVNSILEHGGYYGGYDQHGGGFGQDSYVSYEGQPQPSTSASQEARPSVQSAGSQSAEENKAAATSQAQERHPVSSGKDGESSVDMVELIAGVDTSHPDCRAWIRCLQNARHPDIPLGVRRGRVDVDNSDCRQFAASCPSKKP
ncbi:hypothetical protein FJT64_023727 [Amphibalanus amphitrite]|uniref:Uncharacterized protein n=1 Tax=Amphibalanus amphitrite TaxID=1232801 RepID=A0A6A4WKW1_AMPAM|nr:hypothetical protein FJT64_023727 [Amphibalanus amphitrite]